MTNQDSCATCKHAVPLDADGVDFKCENCKVLDMFGVDNAVTVAGHFCCRGFESKKKNRAKIKPAAAKPVKMDFE